MHGQITNEMLYHLLVDFKNDVSRRFDEVDRRLNRIEKTLDEHSEMLKEHSLAIRELHAGQDKVQIKFTSRIFLFNAFMTLVIASFVSLFLN